LNFGIPTLRTDRLATRIPERVYAGGLIVEPEKLLFLFRTSRFPAEARGGVLGFFVDDYRFEALWRRPCFYAERFASFWGAVCEPDFSLWIDHPRVEQLWSVYKMRTLGRLFQDVGLNVIPTLSWSDQGSFEFCFCGIPAGCPVAACEARTASHSAEDRRRFLAGLTEAVRQVAPQNVLIYAGRENESWLLRHLPPGPTYHLLESWTTVRDRVRCAEERRLRSRGQLTLFPIGGEQWVDEAAQAAGA